MITPQPSRSPDHAIDEQAEAARRYVEQRRAFYIHASMYALGMLVIFTLNLSANISAGIAEQQQVDRMLGR